MRSYKGEDAVDLLQEKLEEVDLPNHNSEILEAFISWLADKEEQHRLVSVLYAWYRMAQHVDFDLADPAPDDIRKLLDQADAGDESEWEYALELFYVAFLQDEREKNVDIPDVIRP